MQVYFKAIRLVLCGMLLGSLVVTTTWFVPQAGAQETVPAPNNDVTVKYLSDSEAFEEDVAQRAQDTGVSVEQVRQTMLFERTFAEYTDILFARYEDSIAGIWVEQEPTVKGHIRFVGEIPAEAAAALATFESLNSDNVILMDDGTISLDEQSHRVQLAADVIVDLGYQNAEISSDYIDEKIDIKLLLPEEVNQPDVDDLVNAIQNKLYQDRGTTQDTSLQDANTIDEADLELTILRGSGPIVNLDSARGGNFLREGGRRLCTSGWAVSGPSGDGIITAGHCNNLDQYEVVGGTPFDIDYQYRGYGSSGDVAYYTTSQPSEAKFNSSSSRIRDVTGLKSTSSMVGNGLCFYGRFSNDARCGYKVESIDAVIVFPDRTRIENIVRVTNPPRVITGGDSGGPWYVGTEAWGSHVGRNNLDTYAYFMPVERTQSVLNVTIKTR